MNPTFARVREHSKKVYDDSEPYVEEVKLVAPTDFDTQERQSMGKLIQKINKKNVSNNYQGL